MRKVSVPAILLLLLAVLSFLFLVHAAAAAGNRRALLPREAVLEDDGDIHGDRQAIPTTAEEEAAVGRGEPQLLADEEMVRRVDLQTQDYPGSGANSRHDPRNPH